MPTLLRLLITFSLSRFRHSPSSSLESGAVNVKFGVVKVDQATSSIPEMEKIPVCLYTYKYLDNLSLYFTLQGMPDVAVVSTDDPHLFMALGEVCGIHTHTCAALWVSGSEPT